MFVNCYLRHCSIELSLRNKSRTTFIVTSVCFGVSLFSLSLFKYLSLFSLIS